MRKRVVILTEIIAPYRIPVFNALAERDDVDLHVTFLSETDPTLRQWDIYRDEIRSSYEVLRSHRRRMGKYNLLLARGVSESLDRRQPEFVICGGYSYLASWQAQRWAHQNRRPFFLWSESNATDARGNFWWVEAAKRKFIRGCDGFIVPGSSAAAYLRTFGVAPELIFTAPNTVDVERFARVAAGVRGDTRVRTQLDLPARYLLYVGRLVETKGVFDLLEAYAKLPERTREVVGLVLVGDGEERKSLLARSGNIRPGRVLFPGFKQRDELAAYYALAEGLVFPTHTDPWGLVVNEALACGLPVIVSAAAGCAADLVRGNGYTVRAHDIAGLGEAMVQVLSSPERRAEMQRASLTTSSLYSPRAWAEGVAAALTRRAGDLNA